VKIEYNFNINQRLDFLFLCATKIQPQTLSFTRRLISLLDPFQSRYSNLNSSIVLSVHAYIALDRMRPKNSGEYIKRGHAAEKE
jgi:hypothetical protein